MRHLSVEIENKIFDIEDVNDAEEFMMIKRKGKDKLNPLEINSLSISPKIIPIVSIVSPYQTITLAKVNGKYSIFLNGEWQFVSGKENEKRFHYAEAYYPTKLLNKEKPNVLIIGGGDGLAARDVLEANPKAEVTLVELDPMMIKFCRINEIMRKLNKGSLDKINVIIGDGLRYMNKKNVSNKFDLVIIDLPDPIRPETKDLYGKKLIKGVANCLKVGGNLSIYSTQYKSPLQLSLAKVFKPYFKKVKLIGIPVKDMGMAGFVYGFHLTKEGKDLARRI